MKLLGDPPDYRTVVKARREEERVGWAMTWNDRPLGWAITLTKPLPHDLTEFRTRVHFDRLPIDDQIAKWSRSWLGTGDELNQEIHLDADNLAVFDPMYGLSRFESSVCFPPSPPLLKVQGTIEGNRIEDSGGGIWVIQGSSVGIINNRLDLGPGNNDRAIHTQCHARQSARGERGPGRTGPRTGSGTRPLSPDR